MEYPVEFMCNKKRLYGILHIPDSIVTPSTVMIIITGGPQVRTGAHRLYVQLSRFLCQHNLSTLRFDYEGLGDSEGNFVGFQQADSSISAAIDFLYNEFTNNLRIILWSLCDGASAAAVYAAKYPECISGLILCNPLVITEEGLAQSKMKHYYSKRIFSREFIYKSICFKLKLKNSVKSFWEQVKKSNYFTWQQFETQNSHKKLLSGLVLDSLQKYKGPIQIVLSTDDIVADNFQDQLKKHKTIRNKYKKMEIINHIIKGADHTFVAPEAKETVFAITLKAICGIECLGLLKVK